MKIRWIERSYARQSVVRLGYHRLATVATTTGSSRILVARLTSILRPSLCRLASPSFGRVGKERQRVSGEVAIRVVPRHASTDPSPAEGTDPQRWSASDPRARRSCGLISPSHREGREVSLSELTRGGLTDVARFIRRATPPRRLVPRLRPSRREGKGSKSLVTCNLRTARPPSGRVNRRRVKETTTKLPLNSVKKPTKRARY